MSSTRNEIWLQGERLDLGPDTYLFPNFQSYNRLEPGEIANDYTETVQVPSTAKNHRLLGHAASAQATGGVQYKKLKAVLTSGGVETLPLALLEVISYSAGEGYELRITGGNRRFTDAIEGKTLQDLVSLDRFNHVWSPQNVLARLPWAYWRAQGYGYEPYDRGRPVYETSKPTKLNKLDPYTLWPSIAAWLVWEAILEQAGFTASPLRNIALFDVLNIPTAQPFAYPEEFREARKLVAGFKHFGHYLRSDPFVEPAPFNFVAEAPYMVGDEVNLSPSPYSYTVPTRGYYDVNLVMEGHMRCTPSPAPGEVGLKLSLFLNGVEIGNAEEKSADGRWDGSLTVSKERLLLSAGDVLTTRVEGKDLPHPVFGGPTETQWFLGTRVSHLIGRPYIPFDGVEPGCRFTVELSEEFPPLGLVRLRDWLPDGLSQLDFVKAMFSLCGIVCQTDPYRDHLHLSTGGVVLSNTARARDWSGKLDQSTGPAGLPERNTAFKLSGDFGKRNRLIYLEDETEPRPKLPASLPPALGYGDGAILIENDNLPADFVLAELPFAASLDSARQAGLVRIRRYQATLGDGTGEQEYDELSPEPRLTLRPEDMPTITGELILVPGKAAANGQPAVAEVTATYTTSASYFASAGRPFDLDAQRTLLPQFWPDTAATLKETRFLRERFRLTAQDVAEFDPAIPVWVAALGDFYLVSKISEFDPATPTEVEMMRLHPTLLPPPILGTGFEFYALEFDGYEFY